MSHPGDCAHTRRRYFTAQVPTCYSAAHLRQVIGEAVPARRNRAYLLERALARQGTSPQIEWPNQFETLLRDLLPVWRPGQSVVRNVVAFLDRLAEDKRRRIHVRSGNDDDEIPNRATKLVYPLGTYGVAICGRSLRTITVVPDPVKPFTDDPGRRIQVRDAMRESCWHPDANVFWVPRPENRAVWTPRARAEWMLGQILGRVWPRVSATTNTPFLVDRHQAARTIQGHERRRRERAVADAARRAQGLRALQERRLARLLQDPVRRRRERAVADAARRAQGLRALQERRLARLLRTRVRIRQANRRRRAMLEQEARAAIEVERRRREAYHRARATIKKWIAYNRSGGQSKLKQEFEASNKFLGKGAYGEVKLVSYGSPIKTVVVKKQQRNEKSFKEIGRHLELWDQLEDPEKRHFTEPLGCGQSGNWLYFASEVVLYDTRTRAGLRPTTLRTYLSRNANQATRNNMRAQILRISDILNRYRYRHEDAHGDNWLVDRSGTLRLIDMAELRTFNSPNPVGWTNSGAWLQTVLRDGYHIAAQNHNTILVYHAIIDLANSLRNETIHANMDERNAYQFYNRIARSVSEAYAFVSQQTRRLDMRPRVRLVLEPLLREFPSDRLLTALTDWNDRPDRRQDMHRALTAYYYEKLPRS